jgi:hypothetical protein
MHPQRVSFFFLIHNDFRRGHFRTRFHPRRPHQRSSPRPYKRPEFRQHFAFRQRHRTGHSATIKKRPASHPDIDFKRRVSQNHTLDR